MRNYQEKLIKSYEQLQIESHHVSRAERKFFLLFLHATLCIVEKFYIAVNRYASIGNRNCIDTENESKKSVQIKIFITV